MSASIACAFTMDEDPSFVLWWKESRSTFGDSLEEYDFSKIEDWAIALDDKTAPLATQSYATSMMSTRETGITFDDESSITQEFDSVIPLTELFQTTNSPGGDAYIEASRL